jgi:hypothetical protein
MQYTDPGERKSPFMIDLDGFRQFSDFPSFSTTEFKPMLNMSDSGWGMNPVWGQGSSGIFDIFSRFFG